MYTKYPTTSQFTQVLPENSNGTVLCQKLQSHVINCMQTMRHTAALNAVVITFNRIKMTLNRHFLVGGASLSHSCLNHKECSRLTRVILVAFHFLTTAQSKKESQKMTHNTNGQRTQKTQLGLNSFSLDQRYR